VGKANVKPHAPSDGPGSAIISDVDALYEILRSGKNVEIRRDAATHLLWLIDKGSRIDPEVVESLYKTEPEITVATALKRILNKLQLRRKMAKDPTAIHDRKLTEAETRTLQEEIDHLRGFYDRYYRRGGAFDEKYHSLKKIDEGGMANVFRAVRRKDNRAIAIKFLRLAELSEKSDPQQLVARFHREGELLTRRLNHPHLLKGYEYGEMDGEYFIVLEYVSGGTLEDLVKKGPLDFGLFKRIALQLCDAVAYIHQEGIIHRDIKPANILAERPVMDQEFRPVDPKSALSSIPNAAGQAFVPTESPAIHAADDEAISIKLADFGLAKDRRGPRLSRYSFAAGTDDFSSPQQLADARDADERDDIFSMGKTFYEMLEGRPLKNGEPYRPVVLADSGRSEAVNTLIRKCVAPEREERWQCVGDLVIAFKRIV
jgi:serine/threonine protein kinase